MTAPTRLVRVLSIPAVHPYVQHVEPVSGQASFEWVSPGAEPSGWAPSPAWSPAWLEAHADGIDVVHVHFGFEHLATAQLQHVVAVLRRQAIGLALTVHDLENPHLVDQGAQTRALDILVPAADVLLTLTPGAAREIQRRWGRTADIVPHPHVVDLGWMAIPRPAHEGFVVGLHAKARANCRPEHVAGEFATAIASLPGARCEPAARGRLTDEQLWGYLAGLDALVLPYAFGTHSGFVEACHDVGTTVVAARTGYLHEQQRVLSFDLGVPGSLTAALREAYAQGPALKARASDRAEQRDRICELHGRVYQEVLRQVCS